MGRLIPAGTGFAHHAERRRTREQDMADQLKELDDAANAQALAKAEAELVMGSSEVVDEDAPEATVAEAGVAAEGAEEATTDA